MASQVPVNISSIKYNQRNYVDARDLLAAVRGMVDAYDNDQLANEYTATGENLRGLVKLLETIDKL